MSKRNRAPVPPAKDSTKAKAPEFPAGRRWTADSYANFEARVGIGTDNQSSSAGYQMDFITRQRMLLEAMYRSSWIVGQAVDVVAEDMTKAAWKITGTMPPDQIAQFYKERKRLRIIDKLCTVLKWGRLYGGALGVHLIQGQPLDTPLNLESVGKDQYRGLYVLDRWLVQPTFDQLVAEMGPEMGRPKFYEVIADSLALKRQKIHHSRIVRMDGMDLPYWQTINEQFWGQSVIERLYDRLVAFDSTTQGAAQLVFKAHLRVVQIEGLREIIGEGGPAFDSLCKMMQNIRRFQSSEGLTVLDANDKFEAYNYTFAGLDDVLLQFGQQLSGALQIPMVRLFGQSPKGLNSTGESDLALYYEKIAQEQGHRLDTPVSVIDELLYRSTFGREPPPDFDHEFNPLAELSEEEKSVIAKGDTDGVVAAFGSGLISQRTALLELRQSSHVTGRWSNITDEDIEAADETLPDPGEILGNGDEEETGAKPPQE